VERHREQSRLPTRFQRFPALRTRIRFLWFPDQALVLPLPVGGMQWCIPVATDSVKGNPSGSDDIEAGARFGRYLAESNVKASTHEQEFSGVSTVQSIGSLASILGCLVVIVTYGLFPPLRRYHSTFVIWIALMGIIYHGSVVAQSQPYGTCCSTAPVTHIALLAQELYFFMLAFNYYYTTKYPFLSTRYLEPLYHLFVWLGATGSGYIASKLAKGSISSYGFCWFSGFSSTTENTLVFTFMIPIGVGHVICLGWYLIATKRMRLSSSTRMNVARTNLDTMRKYLTWSSIYWVLVIIPWIARHKNWVTLNSPEEKAIRFVGRMTMALKGLLTAIVWSRIMDMHSAYLVWKNGSWDEYMKVHDATWILRRQILDFATKGIQYSASLTAEQSEMMVDEYPRAGSSVSRSSVFNPWGGRTDNCHDGGPAMISYELQGRSPDSKAIFRDFHPNSFQEIRRLSGITGESYIKSFAGRTKERFSEGKSGSFLYYTGDQLFILKTCTPSEQRYLLQILPQYTTHIRDNPNSYLCRYVGCHELVVEHHTVSIIVLTNILNNTTVNVDEFYDLKGSWVGRFRALTRKGTKRVCKYCGRDFIVGMSTEDCDKNPTYRGGHGELIVGKDVNWGNRRLRLPDELSHQLGSQLYADSEFLRRINSMDYSLVIGMSRYPSYTFACSDDASLHEFKLPTLNTTSKSDGACNGGDVDTREPSPFFDTTYAQAASPVVSRARDIIPTDACVVSMGIIDILTPWSLRKTTEHWMRVYLQCRDRSGISCVNPTYYAERFRQNVVDVVVFGHGKRSDRGGHARRQNSSKEFIMVDFANTGTPILL
jgi:1-phosphatidylinositol-4-phosphate 5-kinase